MRFITHHLHKTTLFLIVLMVCSCNPINPLVQGGELSMTVSPQNPVAQEITPTPSIQKPETEPIPEETSLPMLTSTPTSINPATPSQSIDSLPDILLGMGTDYFPCFRDVFNEVWLIDSLDNSLKLRISDPTSDLNFPAWSPDGQYIAYVKSQPSQITSIDEYSAKSGSDSLWVYSIADGSSIQVSDPVPSALAAPPGFCDPISYISQPALWSPDGRYLLFQQVDVVNNLLNYYLTDLDEPKTTKVFSQNKYASPMWLEVDSVAYINEQNDLAIMRIGQTGSLSFEVLSSPDTVSQDAFLHILPDPMNHDQNENLTVEIYAIDEAHNKTTDQIWNVALDQNSWEKIQDLPSSTFGRPVLSKKWMAVCTARNQLTIFDRQTWQALWSTGPEFDPICDFIQLGSNSLDREFFSINGFYDDQDFKPSSAEGVWIVDPNIENPQLILNTEDLAINQELNVLQSYDWESIHP